MGEEGLTRERRLNERRRTKENMLSNDRRTTKENMLSNDNPYHCILDQKCFNYYALSNTRPFRQQ